MNRIFTSAALGASVLIVSAVACGLQQPDLKNLSGSIKIDGSSTVYPITTAVDEAIREAGSRIKVTVGLSGTGGGFKRFVVGETDISNASRPITKDEVEAAKKNSVDFIELPVAYDGLSIVVNKSNDFVDYLTMVDIKKIFGAEAPAKTWSEVRSDWPNAPIKVFSPGTDSGTFDYFKEVVVGKEGKIRSDMQVSEDDNVLVTGVARDKNAIGFFGYAYLMENQDKLKVVPVDAGKGPITPTHQTIESGEYAPFSRPLFIYVNKKSAERPEVKAFVDFYLANGPKIVEEVRYVKLPAAITERAKANWAKLRTGTQYLNDKGEKVSGPLSKVYN
ncbi:MAG: PstS family phosphate ABC transporter substrate-binding protein [Phycisphaerales bacterium]|nr:PstS family phosphate ABC transporter substrate-binding protein [Phycisphaerales bacterium]MCI0631534.1 PstS family phosphate ABC transporter substrate-binding protein [Phycisphaerales bacterium]MCI0675581.1 PstS family phosphate ABC transporter substrate-binding protein [Phycisphaerales bacterium]